MQNNATFRGDSYGGDSFYNFAFSKKTAYRAHEFVVDLEGSQKEYNLAVDAVFDYYGYIFLYIGSFNPLDSSQNLVAVNDDCDGIIVKGCITLPTVPGPYVLVVSAASEPYPAGGLYTADVSLVEVRRFRVSCVSDCCGNCAPRAGTRLGLCDAPVLPCAGTSSPTQPSAQPSALAECYSLY